jgi:hypothetical protein
MLRVSSAVGQGLVARWGNMVRNLDTSSKPIEKASSIYMQQGKANQPKQNTTTGKGKLKKQENHPWLYTASTDVQ